MSKDKTDRVKEYYTAFKKREGYYPAKAVIAKGIGISRQAVGKYFEKHETTLKKIPEYRRYYVDNVNQGR